MKSPSIKPRMVVLDQFRRLGIVCEKETPPTQDWIDEQHNSAEIKKLGPTDWWGIMPLTGGYVLAPGPLLACVREAAYEDFLAAADTAQPAGRESLAKLFPDYVNQLLAERRRKDS